MRQVSVIEREQLKTLIDVLKSRAYRVVGPVMREGAIVYDDLSSDKDLPSGWMDVHGAGSYRLQRRTDAALFGYNVGPHSWKKFLHVPALRLWQARANEEGFSCTASHESPQPLALIGVRSCELHAIAIQDRVLVNDRHTDPNYAARREHAFIVAVQCGQAGSTCFCVSMDTGPRARVGFDLALTERIDESGHRFVVETGTERGEEVLTQIPRCEASEDDLAAADRVVAEASAQMGRELSTDGIKELLYGNVDHPRWEEVASRCLACANCTMVCPTCFCTSVEDVTALNGEWAERWQHWDSCFNSDFSYLHGGHVRKSVRSRYRQWLTHKLAAWHDQFGSSGCVGCGRCITWCPAGIDITVEVAAIRETSQVPGPGITV